jgi:hypothetical protein
MSTSDGTAHLSSRVVASRATSVVGCIDLVEGRRRPQSAEAQQTDALGPRRIP